MDHHIEPISKKKLLAFLSNLKMPPGKNGATTLSITTLSIMTLSIMTLSIMTLSITTLSMTFRRKGCM